MQPMFVITHAMILEAQRKAYAEAIQAAETIRGLTLSQFAYRFGIHHPKDPNLSYRWAVSGNRRWREYGYTELGGYEDDQAPVTTHPSERELEFPPWGDSDRTCRIHDECIASPAMAAACFAKGPCSL